MSKQRNDYESHLDSLKSHQRPFGDFSGNINEIPRPFGEFSNEIPRPFGDF